MSTMEDVRGDESYYMLKGRVYKCPEGLNEDILVVTDMVGKVYPLECPCCGAMTSEPGYDYCICGSCNANVPEL